MSGPLGTLLAPDAARLGLGLAALGRPGYMTLEHGADLGDASAAALEQRCAEVLDAAFASGVRYIDAARSYGRSEEFLARWLARLPAAASGQVVVGSKWGYTYTAGWRSRAETHEVKDHSVAAFRRQRAETWATLGARPHAYQIHSVTPESPVLADEAALDELRRLRDQGVVVGLTVSGPRQADVVRRALAVRAGDGRLFGCVQATWNLLEPSVGPALQEAHAAGLSVIVKEGLANGRLAREAPPVLRELARDAGVTADAVALAAALSQPWAPIVLSGAATVPQMTSNLAALRLVREGLGASAAAALTGLAEAAEAYWRRRSTLAWT